MGKKTKAIKNTDYKQQKPWLKKREVSKYEKYKSINKSILIVCEGQSEKLYFESFPVYSLVVQVIDTGGCSKLSLVERTKEIVKKEQRKIAFDSVWCVFDMDENVGSKEYADYDNSIFKAKNLGYKVAYSNDAFELWYYLHYNDTNTKNHRTFYYADLGGKWGVNYEKQSKKKKFCSEIYKLLKEDDNSSQEKAIQRAKRLYEEQKHLAYHLRNPMTKVYELVIFLNENLRP